MRSDPLADDASFCGMMRELSSLDGKGGMAKSSWQLVVSRGELGSLDAKGGHGQR